MTENTDQAMELQAMLPDGQQINDASSAAVCVNSEMISGFCKATTILQICYC